MPLRPEEQLWLPELDDEDPEIRCVGILMLSGENASPEALMEVGDRLFDDATAVRNFVFKRLLEHPTIPPEIGAVAYRFVRRDRYTDKRNYVCALRLMMKANAQDWRDLVSKQIQYILGHEKDEDLKAMAEQVQTLMKEKK